MIRKRMLGPIPYEVSFFGKVFCIGNRVSEDSLYLEYVRKGLHGSTKFDRHTDIVAIRFYEGLGWRAQIRLEEREPFLGNYRPSVQGAVDSLCHYLTDIFSSIAKVVEYRGGENA